MSDDIDADTLVTGAQAAHIAGVRQLTIRVWVLTGRLVEAGQVQAPHGATAVYRLGDLFDAAVGRTPPNATAQARTRRMLADAIALTDLRLRGTSTGAPQSDNPRNASSPAERIGGAA